MLGESGRNFNKKRNSSGNEGSPAGSPESGKALNKLLATKTTSEDPLMTINSDLRDQHAGEIINLQINNPLSIESVNNVINSRKSSGEFRYLEETQPE